MIELSPIGIVHSSRKTISDDLWLKEESYIELADEYPMDSLAGITDFSHVEILFYMDQVDSEKIETSARHPRNNTHWPKVGIFAQRGKNRPNRIGLTICDVLKVDGRKLFVKGLDAIDGTPILDIKPWMKEFGPRGEIHQPAWVSELMRDYWDTAGSSCERFSNSSSIEGLNLRLATIDDLPTLEGWDKEPHVIESDPDDEWDWAIELARFPSWREQLIAEVNGQPIGCIQIIDPKEEETHYWGDCESNLRAIDIWIGEKEFLGKGFGTQMMKLAIERCFAHPKVKAIIIDPLATNKDAISFYERFGFKFVEERIFNEDRCHVMRLERKS